MTAKRERRPISRNSFLTQETQVVKGKRSILKRLWGYVARYKLLLMVGIALSLVSAGASLAGPYLIGVAIDRYIANRDTAGLSQLIVLMLAIYLIVSVSVWIHARIMTFIAQRTVMDLREELFAHCQRLPLAFFDATPRGELMSRLSNDTDTISSTLAESVTQLLSSICSIIGAVVIMVRLCPTLAGVCLVTVPFLMITTKLIAQTSRRSFKLRQQSLGRLNASVQESISCSKVVIALGLQEEVVGKFEKANSELRRNAISALIAVGTMGPCMNMFRNLSLAIVAGSGAYMAARGMTSVGVVASIINYSDHFNRPINQIANIYGTIQSAMAGASRVFEILDEKTEKNREGSRDAEAVKGNVVFENVTFGYKKDRIILKNVSFTANEGEQIALVGSTGAGKTTVINLLTGFYDISSGRIAIDGVDIRDMTRESLRRSLGIVLQDTYLFTGTVRENIRYGRLSATDEEVEQAARLANADAFITALPLGYSTVLTDAGASLSHGQRQLLAIARTILADPAILILDEATSSIDTRTERYIQDALKILMKGRTTFIIAHRLNTIREADCILVVENGEICEKGTHEELINAGGAYGKLYKS